MSIEESHHWVDDLGQDDWRRRPYHGVQLKHEERSQSPVPPLEHVSHMVLVSTRSTHVWCLLQVANNSKQDENRASRHVVHGDALNPSKDIVSNGCTVSPLQNLWPESFVCKALGWINQRVAAELEMNVECFYGCAISWVRNLVWVVLNSPENDQPKVPVEPLHQDLQTPKFRLQPSFFNIVRDPKCLIKVSCLSHLPICFDNGVYQIG